MVVQDRLCMFCTCNQVCGCSTRPPALPGNHVRKLILEMDSLNLVSQLQGSYATSEVIEGIIFDIHILATSFERVLF